MTRIKLLFLSATIFVFQNAFAIFPDVSIKDFQGNYKDDLGTATASDFKVPEANFGQGEVEFEVYKQASNYVLTANGQEFVWENPPLELDQLKTLIWKDVDVDSNPKRFTVGVGILNGTGDNDSVDIEGLQASCDFAPSTVQSDVNDLLHSCLNNKSTLSLRKMAQNKVKAMNSLNNINFNMRKNSFTFSLTSGLRINGNGKIWYLADENLVKIRVDRAKWKFMNVKNRLFNELKAMESDTVKVQNPWIIINVEN